MILAAYTSELAVIPTRVLRDDEPKEEEAFTQVLLYVFYVPLTVTAAELLEIILFSRDTVSCYVITLIVR